MYFNPLNKPLTKKDPQNNPPPWNGLNKAIKRHNLTDSLDILVFNDFEALSVLNLWTNKRDVPFFSGEGLS